MHGLNLDWIIILLFIRSVFINEVRHFLCEKIMARPWDKIWDKTSDIFRAHDSQC